MNENPNVEPAGSDVGGAGWLEELSPKRGEFAVGELICNSYQVVSWLGSGAMGNVYRVKHTTMQTEYALKTLSGGKINQIAWMRFQNEGRAIARLNHPNIVSIYNMDLHNGLLPFYVMDLIDGPSLLDEIRDNGPMELQKTLDIFIEVCLALGYAHKKGIVHRDVKPANIVILRVPDALCRVKIVDFGIAKLTEIDDSTAQALTNAGEVCGSPFYMSPEQTAAQKIDARSDIYSLGCTLYEALTGRPPFRGRSAVDTMSMHQTDAAPSLEKGSGGKIFPVMLESLIQAMLAKTPMDRYQNMELVADDLAAIKNGEVRNVSPYKKVIVEPPKPAETQPPRDPSRLVNARSIAPGTASFSRLDDDDQEDEHQFGAEKSTNKKWLLPVVGVAAVAVIGITAAFVMLKAPVKSTVNPLTTSAKSNSTVARAATVTVSEKNKKMAQSLGESTAILLPDDMLPKDNFPGGATVDQSGLSPWAQYADHELTWPPQFENASNSLHDRTPYSKIMEVKGRPRRVFNFPADFAVGRMHLIKERTTTLSVGRQEYHPRDMIVFAPNPLLIKYPQYFSRFTPGDITTLLMAGSQGSDKLLKAATAMPDVPDVQFFACTNMTKNSLSSIDAMRGLKRVAILESGPPARDFIKLGCLRSLSDISYCANPDTDIVVAALKGDSKLKTLELSYANLSKESVDTICALPNLTSLTVNRMKNHNEEVLAKFCKIPKLETLAIQDFTVNKHNLLTIQSMKNLRHLFVGSKNLEGLSPEELKAMLPRVEVTYDDESGM